MCHASWPLIHDHVCHDHQAQWYSIHSRSLYKECMASPKQATFTIVFASKLVIHLLLQCVINQYMCIRSYVVKFLKIFYRMQYFHLLAFQSYSLLALPLIPLVVGVLVFKPGTRWLKVVHTCFLIYAFVWKVSMHVYVCVFVPEAGGDIWTPI